MDFAVVWTEPASADLQGIVEHLQQQNPSAAERVARGILEKVESLRTLPFLGAVYPRARDPRGRETLSGNYRIFYRVIEDDQRVEVLCVWHGARREPKLTP